LKRGWVQLLWLPLVAGAGLRGETVRSGGRTLNVQDDLGRILKMGKCLGGIAFQAQSLQRKGSILNRTLALVRPLSKSWLAGLTKPTDFVGMTDREFCRRCKLG